ncbi:MAG: Crp/Fnr family transcriptional regulator [Pyrinomonadaceae bacterium]
MSVNQEARPPTANWILSALPPEDYERLAPHLEPVNLTLNQTIYPPHTPVTHVYFPENAMISVVANSTDGASVEVGVIGREGMSGVAALLGVDGTTPTESMVQIADGALRMSAEVMRAEFNRSGAFQDRVLRYMQAYTIQTGQSAACNRIHTVEERLARWLLMTHDRAASDKLALTQEFIAMMLGCRRAGVTSAAITLQGDGFIRYSRGHITLLDRAGLEEFSCECYQIVKTESDRLLKP